MVSFFTLLLLLLLLLLLIFCIFEWGKKGVAVRSPSPVPYIQRIIYGGRRRLPWLSLGKKEEKVEMCIYIQQQQQLSRYIHTQWCSMCVRVILISLSGPSLSLSGSFSPNTFRRWNRSRSLKVPLFLTRTRVRPFRFSSSSSSFLLDLGDPFFF
jgi:hypothetical protein